MLHRYSFAQLRNFRACLRSFRYRRSCYLLCLLCLRYCLCSGLRCLLRDFHRNLGQLGGLLCRPRSGLRSGFHTGRALCLRLLILYRLDRCRRSCCRCRRCLLLASSHY